MAGELLTGRQEAFCNEYLVDLNGTKAAIRAGYSPVSAAEVASQNLRMSNIQARISQLRESTGKGYNITRERIAQELARISFFDIRNIFDDNGKLKSPEDWSDEEAAAVSGLETEQLTEGYGNDKVVIGQLKKVKITDKKGALDSLAKLMGYNAPDKTAFVDPDGNALQPVININVVNPKE